MARSRTPPAKAQVIGAALKNGGRYRDRIAPSGRPALGEPYAYMTEAERTAWQMFVDELPWLNGSHRAMMQLACRLRARLHTDPDVGVNAMQVYSAILSKLGATPADQSRVNMPDESDDEHDRFFH